MKVNKSIDFVILGQLMKDEAYCRKAIPHIKSEYFDGPSRYLYETFLSFVSKYNKLPNATALDVEFRASRWSQMSDSSEALVMLSDIRGAEEETNISEWIIDATEKWCKDRALHLAIMESITIIDGKSEKAEGAIPDILSKALSVSFDTNVGHDYLGATEERFKEYHKKENKIPFDIEKLNEITKGGVPRKTLNIILAGTGVGKSLAMCHMAAASLKAGQNVLYITMEMAETKIAERIDANLFDVDIAEISEMGKEFFDSKINKIREKTNGNLIIKEYPTAAAHAGHFRALLSELKMKKNFLPDIIYIDYLNICASSRMKSMGGSINSYTFIKAIAEEIRGLAVEFDVPIWSATQVTRTGFANSDVEITDTSESFGLPATCDLMIALISTEELEKMNQIMVKQLKNRYNDPTTNKRFCLGLDRSKMRLFDVEDSAQNVLGGEKKEAPVASQPFAKKDFSGFKV